MHWTSASNKKASTRSSYLVRRAAVLLSGLGVGMVLSLSLHYAWVVSGGGELSSSLLLVFFAWGLALGYSASARWMGQGRIQRWGLLGWSGLMAGMISWLMPWLGVATGALWETAASNGTWWMNLCSSALLGMFPALFAGAAAGCASLPSASLKGSCVGPLEGLALVAASVGFWMQDLVSHPNLGLDFSVPMTALLWFLVGAGGLLVKARLPLQAEGSKGSPESEIRVAKDGSGVKYWLYIGCMAGGCMLVWLRVSDWVFGNTHFWHVSWVCLGSLAMGLGWLFSGMHDDASSGKIRWGFGLLGLLCFACLFAYDDLPFQLVILKSHLGDSTNGFHVHAFIYVVFFGWLITIPMFALGILTRWSLGGNRSGEGLTTWMPCLVTAFTAWACFHHFITPWIGLARLAGLTVAIPLSFTLYLLLKSQPKWVGLSRIAPFVLAVMIISFSGSRFQKEWQLIFSQASDLTTGFFKTSEAVKEWAYRSDQIFYRESPQGALAVHSYDYPENTQLEFRFNGEVMERGYVHQIKPVLNAMVPFVLHGGVERVAVMGLRSGMTAGIMASLPAVSQIDGVEPYQDQTEVIRLFGDANGKLLERDNFQLYHDSPYHFMGPAHAGYDLIMNQYARPWQSGDSAYFTLEFYERCRSSLKQDGIMVQNVQIEHMDDPTLQTIIATFGAVFHETSIWTLGHGEYMLIGRQPGETPNRQQLRERIMEPAVQSVLENQGLETWPILLTTQLVAFENGFHLVPDETIVHSLGFPSLRLTAGRAFASPAPPRLIDEANEQWKVRPSILLADGVPEPSWNEEQMRAMSLLQFDHRIYPPMIFRSILRAWMLMAPHEVALQILAASTADIESKSAYESSRLLEYLQTLPTDQEVPVDLIKQAAYHLMETYRDQRSIFHQPDTASLRMLLEQLVESDPTYQRIYRLNLAELAWDRGDTVALERWTAQAFDPDLERFGPLDYSVDPLAPYRNRAIMLEHWWVQGQVDKARDVCIQAWKAKYTGPQAVFHYPPLEQVVRKTLFSLDASVEMNPVGDLPLESQSLP
ncbi:MAG: hypothetical protein P8L18_04800 [Verrucomicrobiota bacterium]|nr:hypothetical protein [Verrucomicrobiota bacterium]